MARNPGKRDDRPTWDEILGDVPLWARRCHLPDRKVITGELLQLRYCKIELLQVLGTLMRQHSGAAD